MPFIMKACVEAIKKHPYVMSSIEEEEIFIKKYFNFSIAIDTQDGLMAPVVKGVDQKNIQDLAKEMQELADKGLLFEAYRKNDFIGIIAADRQRSWFLDGYVVIEELLFQQFPTQKLASAMQRHLIEQLDGDLDQMLYGTIHFDNISSLKTAYRCGRKYCGMYIFADL